MPTASWPTAREAVDRLFPAASRAVREEFLLGASVVSFDRHDVLVEQGDSARPLILLSGTAAARATDAQGREVTLLVLEPGQLSGLRSILRPVPSQVAIVALTHGTLARWTRDLMLRLARIDAGLAFDLFCRAVDEVDLLHRRLLQMSFESARGRFADAVEEYEDLITGAAPRLSRAELASILGISREMLGVVIRDLETQGAIRRTDSVIEVLDWAKLRSCATGPSGRD